MLRFDSLESLNNPLVPARHRAAVVCAFAGLVAACDGRYFPEEDGHVLLIEPGDEQGHLTQALGRSLAEADFDAVVLEGGCFVALVLVNNQYGVTLVIPDEPWLPQDARRALEAVAMPTEGAA